MEGPESYPSEICPEELAAASGGGEIIPAAARFFACLSVSPSHSPRIKLGTASTSRLIVKKNRGRSFISFQTGNAYAAYGSTSDGFKIAFFIGR
jgi:hypothetical protein